MEKRNPGCSTNGVQWDRPLWRTPTANQVAQGLWAAGNLLDPNFTQMPAMDMEHFHCWILGSYGDELSRGYVTAVRVSSSMYSCCKSIYILNRLCFHHRSHYITLTLPTCVTYRLLFVTLSTCFMFTNSFIECSFKQEKEVIDDYNENGTFTTVTQYHLDAAQLPDHWEAYTFRQDTQPPGWRDDWFGPLSQ